MTGRVGSLGQLVKKPLQKLLLHFGLQLRRIPKEAPARTLESDSNRILWLRAIGINTILDIGANTGQFAQHIRRVIPDAMIYSFEPLPDCFEQLKENLANWVNFSAFNLALGDRTGELIFQRNEYSPSSSFLKMADLHREAFPYTRNTDHVTVTTRRLDDLSQELSVKEPLLVKIDVQGYEGHVLRGGEGIIGRASVIIVETSFETLYEGQPRFDDIYRTLVSWGFAYSGAFDQLCSPQDGRPLQQDSIFVNQWKHRSRDLHTEPNREVPISVDVEAVK